MSILLPIALIGVITLIGFIGEVIFRKTNIPNIIWLMIIGLIIGPITHSIDTSLFMNVSEFVAAIAIIMILFDGGIHMKLELLLKEAPRTVLLTITSFSLTVFTVTLVMVLLGQPVMNGILLGAIVGGTSSPVVIPIITGMKGLYEKTKVILSLESVLTDVLCVVTALSIISMIAPGVTMPISPAQALASTFSVGIVLGMIVGLLWIPIIKKMVKYEYSYLLNLAVLFLLYTLTELSGGSGALACLMFGIVLGNGKKLLRMLQFREMAFEIDEASKHFHSMITFLIRTFFFVYIGMLVSVTDIKNIVIGLVLTLIIFVVRPAAVNISMYGIKQIGRKDKQIMSYLIPRGLAAAVLAYLPISKGVPGTQGFADITFTVIFATAIAATVGIGIEKLKEKKGKKK